ncbi:hypothetical protein [Agromyces bauzanensis]
MDSVLSTTDSRTYSAAQYGRLPKSTRDQLADGLLCPACQAEAFFRRRSRNGQAACFGARPHNEGCELGADGTESRGERNLPEAPQRETAVGEFRLEPMRDRTVGHVDHNEEGAVDRAGRGRQYTLPPEGGQARPSRNLSSLLRDLVNDQEYRNSDEVIHLDDGTQTTVADWCVHSADVTPALRARRRLYWGTIRNVGVGSGAYFLNTGRGAAPTVVVREVKMAGLLARKRIDDPEDLVGGTFIIHDSLGYSSERYWLHVNDLEWFTVRLEPEDPIL